MGKRSDFDRIPRDFIAKAKPVGDCLIWSACVGSDGYGHVRYNGKVSAAHRVSFEMSRGREPRGHILHSCDNPLCINPKHLSEGSHAENMRQCVQRGRNRSPRAGNGVQKLSHHDRAVIRQRFNNGETNKSALAREFGVTAPRIRQVLNG